MQKDNHMHDFQKSKASSHEGDIPVEELMKIQKKLQNQQKKKNKEPEFVDWEKAKYPGQSKDSNKGNDEWGNFVGSDFKFPEGQQDQGNSNNNNFDTFGFFNSDEGQPAAAKQDDQSWGAFEFGGTTNATNTATEQTSNANAGWSGDLWDAPQFDTKKEEEKPQGSNTTADNFDFFGDFSSGNDQKN